MTHIIHLHNANVEDAKTLLADAGIAFTDTLENALKINGEDAQRAARILRNRIVLHVMTRG